MFSCTASVTSIILTHTFTHRYHDHTQTTHKNKPPRISPDIFSHGFRVASILPVAYQLGVLVSYEVNIKLAQEMSRIHCPHLQLHERKNVRSFLNTTPWQHMRKHAKHDVCTPYIQEWISIIFRLWALWSDVMFISLVCRGYIHISL